MAFEPSGTDCKTNACSPFCSLLQNTSLKTTTWKNTMFRVIAVVFWGNKMFHYFQNAFDLRICLSTSSGRFPAGFHLWAFDIICDALKMSLWKIIFPASVFVFISFMKTSKSNVRPVEWQFKRTGSVSCALFSWSKCAPGRDRAG